MPHIHGGVWVIPCRFTFYGMQNWHCIRLSHKEWTCMWWYGMTMHGNVWYWLIFKVCVGRLRLSRIPRHAWWMYENETYPGDVRVAQDWFTCDGSPSMTHAPITPIHSYDDTPILHLEESYKHCECMRVHENDWEWLRMSHIHGGVWVIPCWFTFYDMHENELALHQTIP